MTTKQTACILLLACLMACNEKQSSKGGLSPQEALSTFQIADGFKIEQVASEPMISDPVAMDVDEYGNIYAVEMHGYPMERNGAGVIKLLTDTNDDGLPDKSTVFADNLGLPTGIMKWKKGVLVVDVPNIFYLEDTNGDGKADVKKVMITGLALTNPQHIANTPIFGLDGWIYVAHMETITPNVAKEFSDSGDVVRFADMSNGPQLPRNANGRNIRFKPDTHQLEMLSGASQYGQTFDDWGHQLCTENADHLFFEAIAARYLQRNPNLLVASADDYISDHGEACEVYPITINPEHQLLTDVGVVTSSCGVTWYQGGLFPDSFNNITFIAEPVHNLMHADRINENGASFSASRVYHKKEFLASTDAWFRPVQFYNGPDGALYVLDYYRQIIEHPEWLSDDVINSGQLYNGSNMGRIYRITPTTTRKIDWCGKLNLANASTEELVQKLSSTNIWWRRTAQRLLMDRRSEDAVPLLQKLLDTTSYPTAIVHALWTLQNLNALDVSYIEKALKNTVAGVRENAIKIAELHLDSSSVLEKDLLAMQNDPSAKVRYQLLCTLGNSNDAQAEAVNQKLLMQDIEDKWVQIAALSSSYKKEYALLEKSIATIGSNPSPGKTLFFENCAAVVALSENKDEIKKIIQRATRDNTTSSAWWQAACLNGLAKGAAVKNIDASDLNKERSLLLAKFNVSTPAEVRKASLNLLSVIGVRNNEDYKQKSLQAQASIQNTNADVVYRTDALQLIALMPEENRFFENGIERLVTPDEPEALQQNALFTLNKLSPEKACHCIVNNWKSFSPELRDVSMDVFLSSPKNMDLLLNAVQKKEIQTSAISWPRMVQLMNNDDEHIRNRSRELLAGKTESRDDVYKQYTAALSMKGNAQNGLKVFSRVCTACHQVGGQYGHAFGPDLGSIRNREAQYIMADILNPNRSIADKFDMWTVTKKNGDKLNGIISSETSAAITLNNLDGKKTTVARSDIKSLEASQTSAMPVGLEKSVSVEEMADLLAFLKNVH